MKCHFCLGEQDLIWGADFSFEDYGIFDTEGIVATLHCPNCGADYEGFLRLDEEE